MEHGFQKIGSLVENVSRSRERGDSTRNRSGRLPMSSETTGLPVPMPVPERPTGAQHGVTGYADRIPLAEMDSRDVDMSLPAWLPRSVNFRAGYLERWAMAPWQETANDPATADDVHDYPPDDARRAMDLLRRLNEPASPDFCRMEVGRLKVTTSARNMGQDDLDATIAVLGEELARYPPDVVRSACRHLGRSSKWFPSLSELMAECEDRVGKRRRLLRGLERYWSGHIRQWQRGEREV